MSAFETILELSGFREAKEDVIPREVMGRVLEAGRNTPSPGNVQTLEFVVVENDDRLENLAQTIGDHRFAEAPLAVAVIADENRMERKVGEKSSEFCMAEAATAVQNMRLVAEEEGISSVWRTGFDTKTVSQQLKVPGERKAVSLVAFAYTDSPVESEPRFGMNEVVFYDEYGNQIESFFDKPQWRGLEEETEIYSKKSSGLKTKLRRKLEKVL